MSTFYDSLNPPQKQGVETTEDPVLILAGAGSGKTRVLTYRIAHLIQDLGVAPYNIMAITFTNKAAGEMRSRVDDLIGVGGGGVWVATFHSSCVKILRRFADRIGYDTNFTIYDTDDAKAVMKEVCKRLEIDTKIHKEKTFMNVISSAKDNLIGPEEFLQQANMDYNKQRQGQVYREYQSRLMSNNAMDFDDLIVNTVRLLKYDPEVRNYYQDKFHYVMVDEYQDTNTAQFELIRLLAGGRNNLCVVGDDDQSIYKFRGANIYNILNFEDQYPNATVIKLEQNYRSTSNILDAANAVIANNAARKQKRLWTESGSGSKIRFRQFDSAYEEASFVAGDISSQVYRKNYTYNECAVLYRTNAQSRILEEKFINSNIPYKIVGGVNFYSRKEIKDILAYLKTIDNAADEVAIKRIINVPKRGIGATTLSKVSDFAYNNDMTFYDTLSNASSISSLERSAAKIKPFVDYIESKRKKIAAGGYSLFDLVNEILEDTGYVAELKAENSDESKARIENIDEFLTKVANYEEEVDEPTLSGFLEEVALVADIDSLDEQSEYVVLMTLHAAKGLEFENVYLVGMEDGLFPSQMCIGEDPSEMEEERRLAYVGITRAKCDLTLSAAKMRMVRGETRFGAISRFVKEIPENLIEGSTWEEKPRGNFYFDDDVMPVREPLKKKPTMAQTYAAKNFGTKIEKGALDYGVNDRVSHKKFGEGTVLSIVDGGRDFEVTVEFDSAGTKKMFASFAKLEKI